MADEKINTDTMRFLTFGNADLPVFREVKQKEWIYYGEKNDFPYYLIDLYTESAYHKAIIDGKVDYISGGGWAIKTDKLNTEQKALSARILEQPFGIYNLNEATLRWTLDMEMFNGITIHGVWSKDKKTASLNYIDMANIRTNADESKFFYTNRWFIQNMNGVRVANNKPEKELDWKVYEKYDNLKREGEFIYYWKAPYPTQKVYPIPVYQGAVRWINIDISLAKYFFHTVENAFVPTHLINFFNGEPSQEKSDAIEKRIKEKWTKPDGARLIVNFAKSKDTAADVQTLQMTDADKQYDAVRKFSEQAIFTGHRVTSSMLFGIAREGALGGRSELIFAEEHFQNAYITNRQHILENIINELASDFGMTSQFYLNRVRRVGYMFDDATIVSVLNQEEKRKYVLEQLGITEIKNSEPQIFNSEVITNCCEGDTKNISEKEWIDKFKTISKDYSNTKLLYEREMHQYDLENVRLSEQDFISNHFAETIKATTLERSIIDLLTKDSTLQPEAIATATNKSVSDIKATLSDLVDRKMLKPQKINIGNDTAKSYDVTNKGTKTLEQKPAKTVELKVVYRYGLSFKFKGESIIIPTSREWCREISALSESGKRWTSEDIFSLTPAETDINPWTQRGGWYTKPNTNIRLPQCRHAWIQELRTTITN
jgi:predicted transcriptional regulator